MKKRWVFLLFFLFPSLLWAERWTIGEVEYRSFSDYTRIVFNLPQDTGYVVREIPKPPSLLINFYPANLTEPLSIPVQDRFVESIRLVQDTSSVVKATISLSHPSCTYSIFSLPNPPRVVVDIKLPAQDLLEELIRREEEKRLFPKKFPPLRVVLDPGHGGEDPGAIGPAGTQEKDITLKVGLETAQFLEEKGIKVYLTRRGDYFVPLEGRTELANRWEGDLFISIHANASYNGSTRGIETYFNSDYVFGEGAEKVALRENFQKEGIEKETEIILWDMVHSRYRQQSNDLSHHVQRELVKETGLEDRGVRSAKFFVLRGINMPACLVEVGFISNPWEERKLRKESFIKKIARGIGRGVLTFIEKSRVRESFQGE